ncbi:zinc ABC transporter ATP-binding protein [Candidatus Magnetoovum chiemensis]|nr:zinc ABC transporter ATP-binding protein [Candidatus Magnetoovum chiemensis]
MTNTNCIEVKDVNFSYNNNLVLENISFDVKTGEYLGIIGPNGSGKTTLIKIILGLINAASGKITILGKDINKFKERYKIGYVPQRMSQSGFSFPATVYEVIQSGLTPKLGLFKRPRKTDITYIEHIMDITKTSHYRDRLIGKLSGGQKQMVFIAKALVGDPEILILDEPVTGVDIASQEKFYKFIEHLNKTFAITIIFITHDLGVISKEASSILCINKKVCCYAHPDMIVKDNFLEEIYGRKVSIHKHL